MGPSPNARVLGRHSKRPRAWAGDRRGASRWAFGLFAGAYSGGRRAWLYPMAALTLYVVGMGGYQWLVMGAVYLGFAGPALIGAAWLRGRW